MPDPRYRERTDCLRGFQDQRSQGWQSERIGARGDTLSHRPLQHPFQRAASSMLSRARPGIAESAVMVVGSGRRSFLSLFHAVVMSHLFSSTPNEIIHMAREYTPTPSVRAPEFPDNLDWIHTGGQPLKLADLRGKIVFLDFWTYG